MEDYLNVEENKLCLLLGIEDEDLDELPSLNSSSLSDKKEISE